MVHVTLTATICWSASQRSWVQLSRLVCCPDSWPQLLIVAGVRQSVSLTILPQLLQFSPCPLLTPDSTLSVGNDNVKVEYR